MKGIRFALVAVLAASAFIFNRPLRAASPVTNRWDASFAAGMALTRGNSETFLGTLAFKATTKTTNNEVLLGATGSYGESTTEVTEQTQGGNNIRRDNTTATAANAAAHAQFNHLFTDRIYGGGRVDFVHDAIADLKYRATVSPLVGYYVIRTPETKIPTTKLGLEFGPSGVFERQGTEDNQYAALRLGDRFEHKFTPKNKVWQAFDYIPQVDEFHNYLLLWELGAEASITQQFSLRAVLQDTYDNDPAEGRKKNDLKLITSLVYKF